MTKKSDEQSTKDMTDKYWNVPQAVKDTKPVVRVSARGNQYTTWTPAWFNTMVRGQLREIFHQWPRRKEVLDRVRIEEMGTRKDGSPAKRPTVWHICEQCGAKCKVAVSKTNPHKYKRIWVDHIEPVTPPDRNIGWQEFLERLFCDPANLQALCDDCHKKKTNSERVTRAKETKPTWRK